MCRVGVGEVRWLPPLAEVTTEAVRDSLRLEEAVLRPEWRQRRHVVRIHSCRKMTAAP